LSIGLHLDALELVDQSNKNLTRLFQKFLKSFENIDYKCIAKKEGSYNEEIKYFNVKVPPNIKVDNIVKSHPRIQCITANQKTLYYLGKINGTFDIQYLLKVKSAFVFLEYRYDGNESFKIIIYSEIYGLVTHLVMNGNYDNYAKLTAYREDEVSVRMDLLLDTAFKSTNFDKLFGSFDLHAILSTNHPAKFDGMILNSNTIKEAAYAVKIDLPYKIPSLVSKKAISSTQSNYSSGTIFATVVQSKICNDSHQVQMITSGYNWRKTLLGSFLSSVYPNPSKNIVKAIELISERSPMDDRNFIILAGPVVSAEQIKTCFSKYNGFVLQEKGVSRFSLTKSLKYDPKWSPYKYFGMKRNIHLDKVSVNLKRNSFRLNVYVSNGFTRTVIVDNHQYITPKRSKHIKFKFDSGFPVNFLTVVKRTFFDTFHLTKFRIQSRNFKEFLAKYITETQHYPNSTSLVEALNFAGMLPLKIVDDEVCIVSEIKPIYALFPYLQLSKYVHIF